MTTASHSAKSAGKPEAKKWRVGAGKAKIQLGCATDILNCLISNLEVTYILQTRAYTINYEERIPVIKNWLGHEGLLLMEFFM